MSLRFPYSALSHFGVELEYMIVSRDSLRVLPIADRILDGAVESEETDIPHGALNWSNELVRHVLEFKNGTPVKDPSALLPHFGASVAEANRQLSAYHACLMPSGMHPDFRPLEETVLWPYGNHAIYQRFNEIFDCRGHGWSNLQSTHLNLSFGNEEEFVRLHAVIRLVLPLLPALAASSPLVENQDSTWKSARLRAYAGNCSRLPALTGRVIPEAIHSIQDYETRIYAPIREAVTPWNHDDLLDPVWVNARGAIARFDRGSIEIRVLDLQECPAQDIALTGVVIDLIRAFYDSSASTQHFLIAPQQALEDLFFATAEKGTNVHIPTELAPWFYQNRNTPPSSVLKAITDILESDPESRESSSHFVQLCQEQGNLAERILRVWQHTPHWYAIGHKLCDCLTDGQIFRG